MRISDWSSDVCSSDLACFLDQFGLAERATDWRGNNNIAESIIGQLRQERFPEPAWIVCGAGTGGTSATIGRYLRYIGLPTRLCVAEPAGMAFACAWRERNHDARATNSTCIERSEEHTSELQSLMRTSYAVFRLQKKKQL